MIRRLPTSVLRSTTRIPILVSSPAQGDGLNSPVRHERGDGEPRLLQSMCTDSVAICRNNLLG